MLANLLFEVIAEVVSSSASFVGDVDFLKVVSGVVGEAVEAAEVAEAVEVVVLAIVVKKGIFVAFTVTLNKEGSERAKK